MELKKETKTTHHVRYYDLEAVVNHHFNLEYPNNFSFHAAEEIGEVSKVYNVERRMQDIWEKKEFEIREGDWLYGTKTILTLLCVREIIEPGCYVISG